MNAEDSETASSEKPQPANEPQRISFEALSLGAKEVIIQHHGEEYRLRATRNGGLILNK